MFCIQTGKCLQSLASLLSWFCRRSLDVPIKTCVNKTHQISINFGKISQKKGQELSPAQLTLPPFAISSTDFKSFWCCNQGPSYYWDYSHKYVPLTFSQDPNITWSSLFRSTHPWLLYEKTKSTITQLFFPLYPQRGRNVLPLPYGLFKPFCGTLNELFYDLPLDLPSDQIFVWILSFFQCVRSSLSTWFTVFSTLTQSINWSILGLINLGSNSFF